MLDQRAVRRGMRKSPGMLRREWARREPTHTREVVTKNS